MASFNDSGIPGWLTYSAKPPRTNNPKVSVTLGLRK